MRFRQWWQESSFAFFRVLPIVPVLSIALRTGRHVAKYRIICNRSILGKGLHRVIIRAPDSVRVRERLQEEVFQQFTVFHDGTCHTRFDAQSAAFDQLCRGRFPPVSSHAKNACLPTPSLRGYPVTPQQQVRAWPRHTETRPAKGVRHPRARKSHLYLPRFACADRAKNARPCGERNPALAVATLRWRGPGPRRD